MKDNYELERECRNLHGMVIFAYILIGLLTLIVAIQATG